MFCGEIVETTADTFPIPNQPLSKDITFPLIKQVS